MKCPRCKSENVTVQMMTSTQLKKKGYGCLWWLVIGWWWIPVKWLCFTFFALLAAFLPKQQKIVQKNTKMCICQSCGHSWKKMF